VVRNVNDYCGIYFVMDFFNLMYITYYHDLISKNLFSDGHYY